MWFKYLLIILFALGAFRNIQDIGAPRLPVTPESAAWTVVISMLLIVGIIYYL